MVLGKMVGVELATEGVGVLAQAIAAGVEMAAAETYAEVTA